MVTSKGAGAATVRFSHADGRRFVEIGAAVGHREASTSGACVGLDGYYSEP